MYKMEALMFYDIVNNLCKERKTTITRMAEDIGLSNAAPTSWRKGSVPKLGTVKKISEYFDVPVEYLLGEEAAKETKKAPTPKGEREYSDLELIEAVMRADEQTREVIRLILERK
jgi:transcriptional regulator with XRE-family HTH domain